MKKVKEYPELQQKGWIMMDKDFPMASLIKGQFGIQVATDGRVWICINGRSFLRFRPYLEGYGEKETPDED